MSRQRFNELVEGYARGELDPRQAREFLVLVQGDDDLAREAEQTREMVRLIREIPKPAAPPGLLHGALKKAHLANDTTPTVDTTPAANVILVPGSGGNMRRIPIHSENAATDVAQADPQVNRQWRHYNWGMIAASIAVLIVGGIVAVEIGPALLGDRRASPVREGEEMYLATSTVYESEQPASESTAPGRTATPRGEGVGFSATYGRQQAALFAQQEADEIARGPMELPTEDPGVMPFGEGAFGSSLDGAEMAALPPMSMFDSAQVRSPTGAQGPQPGASNLEADGHQSTRTADSLRGGTALQQGPALEGTNREAPVDDRSARQPRPASEADVQMLADNARAAEPNALANDSTDHLSTNRREESAREFEADRSLAEPESAKSTLAEQRQTEMAAATPPPRVLTPLEVEFILAQARVAGGGEAPPRGLGFEPLPREEAPELARPELAMVFPDRRAYESFLERLEMTPLEPVDLWSPRDSRDIARRRDNDPTSRRSTTDEESLSGGFMGSRGMATPSPVTGLVSPSAAPSQSAPSRSAEDSSSDLSNWNYSAQGRPGSDDVSTGEGQFGVADGPEIGKPLDLTNYRLHLTTDVETGQVRVTMRPVQPGESASSGDPPTRTPSAPPGARR